MPTSKSDPNETCRLLFSKRVRKAFRKLDPDLQARLRSALYDLKERPRPSGTAKLRGHDALYRVRVGDYRIIYEISDSEAAVYVLRIRHRSDACQGL